MDDASPYALTSARPVLSQPQDAPAGTQSLLTALCKLVIAAPARPGRGPRAQDGASESMAVKGNEARVHDDKKERSTDTHNVDEPQKHHAEGKKPDAKGHMSYDPGHAAGGRGGTSEDGLSFWGRENILKWTVVIVTQRYECTQNQTGELHGV